MDPGQEVPLPAGLGPPPRDKAKYPNRMSPSGIPMFYGAADKKTAIAETYDWSANERKDLVLAQFATAREMSVLDLRRVLEMPSIFDERHRHLRPGIQFLTRFIADFVRPIVKDGREHIEYVPTQIVTEYFRHVYPAGEGGPVQGVLYNSAQDADGECCVLFFETDACCSTHEGWTAERQEFGDKEPNWWLGCEEATAERVEMTPVQDRIYMDDNELAQLEKGENSSEE